MDKSTKEPHQLPLFESTQDKKKIAQYHDIAAKTGTRWVDGNL